MMQAAKSRKRVLARSIDNSHEGQAHARNENGVKKHRTMQEGTYGAQLTVNGTGAPPAADWEHRQNMDKSHAFDIRPFNNPLLRGLTSHPIKATYPEEHAYAPMHTGAAAFTPYDQNATNLHIQQTYRNHSSGLRSSEHLAAPGGRTLNDKSARINPTHGYIPTQNQYRYQHAGGDHQGPNAPERNPNAVTNITIEFKSPEHERKCDQIMATASQYHAEGNHNPSGKKNGLTPEEEKMVISISLAGLFAVGSITAYVFRGSIATLWELAKAALPTAIEGGRAAIGAALQLAVAGVRRAGIAVSSGFDKLKATLTTLFAGDAAARTTQNEGFNNQGGDSKDAPAEGEDAPAESEQAPEGGAEAEGNAEGAESGGAQNAPEINQGEQAGNQAREAGGESFSIDEGLAEAAGGEAPDAGAGVPESGAAVGSVEGTADANAVGDAALPIADSEFVEPTLEEANALFGVREEEPSYMSQLYDFFKTNVLGQASEFKNIAGLPEVPEPITVRLPYSDQAIPLSQTKFSTAEEAADAGYLVEGSAAFEAEGGAGAAIEAGRMLGVSGEGAETIGLLADFGRV